MHLTRDEETMIGARAPRRPRQGYEVQAQLPEEPDWVLREFVGWGRDTEGDVVGYVRDLDGDVVGLHPSRIRPKGFEE